jgi:hypothetical protein
VNPRPPLETCPNCGCRDLFVRKDFPQVLGMTIVALAALTFIILAASRQTFWLGACVLVIAAVVDAILYLIVPKLTVCYHCRGEFKGAVNPKHGAFELSIAEKYRQNG